MNLALGTLYGWSVFVAPLEKQFGWKRADTSMVFTIAVVVFALGQGSVAAGVQFGDNPVPRDADIMRTLTSVGFGAMLVFGAASAGLLMALMGD